MPNPKKVTPERITQDYKKAVICDTKWAKEAREDLKFALGDQWDKQDKEILTAQGRPALTFNIIQPLIFLATGYQRQTRSSIRAYPEGGEDQVKSEVATALVKKVCQRSKVENKLSSAFENGLIIGKAFLEPYVDYTEDLINGNLHFKIRNPFAVRVDPDAMEYDLSDADYVIVEDYFTRDKLIEMFPDKKSKIRKIQMAKDPLEPDNPVLGDIGDLGIKKTNDDIDSEYDNVFNMDEKTPGELEDEKDQETLHFIEYQYKKVITHYLAADALRGKMQLFKDKKEAQLYLDQLRATEPMTPEVMMAMQQQNPEFTGEEQQKIIERPISQVWIASMIEDEVIEDILSPHYPTWKRYSIIPFFANYTPLARTELDRDDLAYQGIVRGLKDPQREKNKRRSQMLHHLNTSANSGWISVEGAWVDPEKVAELGSSAGVHLEYKEGKEKPERITPASISQGHLVLEQAAEQDIKSISGINADMLAVEDKTASGRAIALRQQQGFLMLKRIFDNFSWTQEIVGRYILTQLGKLFTLESAALVLGPEFIVKNQVTPQIINEVLTSAELGLYDVTIGEGLDSPTQRYANYSMMAEMAKSGVPIPPDVMVDFSDIPDEAKKRILAQLTAMQQQAQINARQPGAAVSPKRNR